MFCLLCVKVEWLWADREKLSSSAPSSELQVVLPESAGTEWQWTDRLRDGVAVWGTEEPSLHSGDAGVRFTPFIEHWDMNKQWNKMNSIHVDLLIIMKLMGDCL